MHGPIVLGTPHSSSEAEQKLGPPPRFLDARPEAIPPYLEHCMPRYSVEPGDPDRLARQVMNFEVLAHFQAGEQRTMDLGPA